MLVNYCCKKFKESTGEDLLKLPDNKKPRILRKLRNECVAAKIVLSNAITNQVNCDSIYNDNDLVVDISRATFEHLCQDYFDKTFKVLDEVLKEASVDKKDLDQVILIGGSTRIPKVQEMIKDYFPDVPIEYSLGEVSVDEAVAMGAALHAK